MFNNIDEVLKNLEEFYNAIILAGCDQEGDYEWGIRKKFQSHNNPDHIVIPFANMYSNQSDSVYPMRAWYNSKRNLIVEASFKGACRSLDNIFINLNMLPEFDEKWVDLGEYTRPQDIWLKNPEVYTLVRDPIARYASYVRFINSEMLGMYGLCLSDQDILKDRHLELIGDSHATPQFTHVRHKFSVEDFSSYDEKLKDLHTNLFNPSDPLGVHQVLSTPGLIIQDVVHKFLTSFLVFQDMFDLDKVVPSNKYYWVWDCDTSYDIIDAERNHINFLLNDLNIDAEKLSEDYGINLTEKIGNNTSNFKDSTMKFIQRHHQELLSTKKLLVKDYEWIDSLYFENTPDGKAKYIF